MTMPFNQNIDLAFNAGLNVAAQRFAGAEFFDLFTSEPQVFECSKANNKHYSDMRMGVENAAWRVCAAMGLNDDSKFSFRISDRYKDIAAIKQEIKTLFEHTAIACAKGKTLSWEAKHDFVTKVDDLLYFCQEFERDMTEANNRIQ